MELTPSRIFLRNEIKIQQQEQKEDIFSTNKRSSFQFQNYIHKKHGQVRAACGGKMPDEL